MNCPSCEHDKNDVIDSRPGEGFIRRRRQCRACVYRWSTVEIVELQDGVIRDAVLLHSRAQAIKKHLAAALEILEGRE